MSERATTCHSSCRRSASPAVTLALSHDLPLCTHQASSNNLLSRVSPRAPPSPHLGGCPKSACLWEHSSAPQVARVCCARGGRRAKKAIVTTEEGGKGGRGKGMEHLGLLLEHLGLLFQAFTATGQRDREHDQSKKRALREEKATLAWERRSECL